MSTDGGQTNSSAPAPRNHQQTNIISNTKAVIQGLDTLKNEHNQVGQSVYL